MGRKKIRVKTSVLLFPAKSPIIYGAYPKVGMLQVRKFIFVAPQRKLRFSKAQYLDFQKRNCALGALNF
jgi:hypothetical protein